MAKHNLVIVESPAKAKTIKKYLGSGYEVVDVPNGDEALRVFDENNGNFDICLLDIMMPGKDGFTVCKEIRKRSSTVGIIMLSAKSQEMDKVGALMFGADDYVTKPFGPAELVARVDALHRRVNMVAAKPIEDPNEIRSGPFVLNERSRTLTKNGKNIARLTSPTVNKLAVLDSLVGIVSEDSAMDEETIRKERLDRQ